MKGRDLIKQLQKEGWILERVNGSHHMLVKGNKKVVIPVHNKDLGIGLLNKLLKQVGKK